MYVIAWLAVNSCLASGHVPRCYYPEPPVLYLAPSSAYAPLRFSLAPPLMTARECIRRSKVSLPPASSEISDDLGRLLESMLEKDPSRRASLRMLRQHPWCTSEGPLPPPLTNQAVDVTVQEVKMAITMAVRLKGIASKVHKETEERSAEGLPQIGTLKEADEEDAA